MKLPSIAVERPITTLMVVLIVIVLGTVSLGRLNIDLLPNMSFPAAVVVTTYEGVGPQEIESLVTRPVEEALGTVQNVKNITSLSQQGMSLVIAEFNWGTDMDFATLNMREKIDLFKRFFPDGVDSPMIFKFDPAMMPIMSFAISGDMDQAGIRAFSDDIIKSRLERIEGVASVETSGGLVREIHIVIHPERLKGYNMSIAQVAQALQLENLNLPGGKVYEGRKEFIIRTVGEFRDIEDIKDIIINTPMGASVLLRDIADVEDTFKDVESFALMDGKPCVGISVQKQTDFNTVKVTEKVNKELEKIKEEYPEIELYSIFDQARFIRFSINNLIQNGLVGGTLAVLILYVFLRSIMPTFIISIAIPISVIATFILVYFANLTLNMVSLGGLALGLGMLVDNSIVVLENIYRFRQDGYGRIEASKLAAEEVGTAILASTLTTMAVFLPIVYVKGLASVIFKELGLTVSFSLLASLIVSLTLVPVMCSRFLRVSGEENHYDEKRFLTKLSLSWQRFFEKIEQKYFDLLKWSLGHRKIVVIAAACVFLLVIFIIPFTGMEFLPDIDEGRLTVSLKLPAGTRLEETHRVLTLIEQRLKDIPEVEQVFMTGGSSEGGVSLSSGPELGSMWVQLSPMSGRSRSTEKIAEDARERLRDIPGADIKVESQSLISLAMGSISGSAPVSIEIKGDDLERLKEIADIVAEEVSQVEGTREVDTSMSEERPEVQIKVDKQKAASYGLSTAQVATAVEAGVKGKVATMYRVGGEEIDVRVRLDKEQVSTIADISSVTIASPMGFQVPLDEVADISVENGPLSVTRKNQGRIVTVTSQIAGRDLGNVTKDIQAKLKNIVMPEGYYLEFGGERKEMIDAFQSLLMALILGMVLVYMIMASQFESLLHPFVIMFSVPLAFTGAFFALLVMRRTLNVASFIGIIMLTGIVVNNAIILVDYINILRMRGLNREEAILKAGPTRLRPILMTTLTTVLGMLPLAISRGEGHELSTPMATAVIGGLTVSTLLTLVVVPVFYTIFDGFNVKDLPFFKKGSKKTEIRKEGV